MISQFQIGYLRSMEWARQEFRFGIKSLRFSGILFFRILDSVYDGSFVLSNLGKFLRLGEQA